MTSLLMRTGSMPVQTRFIPSRKVTPTISRHNSVESLPSHGGDRFFSAGKISIDGMRRVSSQSDVIRSERMSKSVVPKPSPAKIPEEDDDEIRFSDGDRSKIGDYYREMLKANPNNSLLLMNYGKFLYEVEKDAERAEEYYGRAILENPGDGEALSMYGKLIWETKGDEKRARCYFDQAVIASPDDCMVMGSYAHFMWEAEDDEDDEEEEDLMVASPALVSAV